MNAKQAFKTAYRTARSMRADAAGQAEFNVVHNRYFTSQRFKEAVRVETGMRSWIEGPGFVAAGNAAHVVAVAVACGSKPAHSLKERLEIRKASEIYYYT